MSYNNNNNNTIQNPDMLAIKAFIQAQDATAHSAIDPDIVVVDLTHSNLQQEHIEIRFYKKDSLYTLRQRIHRQTGTPPLDQHLQVYDGDQLVAEIPAETSDDYVLGRFGLLHHGMRVHCVDTNPHSGSAGGAYEDTSLVQKFTLTEEAYDAREATLRAWAKEQKRQNPNFTLRQHAEAHRALVEAQRAHRLGLALPEGFFLDSVGNVVVDEPDLDVRLPPTTTTKKEDEENAEYGESSVAHAVVGDRCQVTPGDRRGQVAYIGRIPEIASGSGYWIGVALDEPLGQNEGTFGGKHYFTTMGPKYGCVARGMNVQVGDFPEKDLLLDSDESDDEDEI